MQVSLLIHQHSSMLIASKTLICSTVVLYSKFLVCTIIQGGKSFRAGTRPPEDTSFKSLAKGVPQTYGLEQKQTPEVVKARVEDVRWRRLIQNDLESLPLSLIVLTLCGSLGESSLNDACIAVYTVARIAHSVAYAFELQPLRSRAWLFGLLSVLVAGVNGVIKAVF